MRRLVHISDLHFGSTSPETAAVLEETIQELAPDVLVVSGDLTQRARTYQFRAAAEFLRRFAFPQVVVPGNHDIPLYNLVARFRDPFMKYATHISSELEPAYEDEEILVAGVATPKRHRVTHGHVGATSLAKACERLQRAAGKVKVLVSHHPLELFRSQPGRRLLRLEPDVLLAGHLHLGSVRTTAAVTDRAHRSLVLVQAGTSLSTRLRGEVNTFNLLEVHRDRVEVIRYARAEERRFTAGGRSSFRLAPEGWLPGTGSALSR
jgi:3',5'-cyclic AMP phosphodiesterase CpdA